MSDESEDEVIQYMYDVTQCDIAVNAEGDIIMDWGALRLKFPKRSKTVAEIIEDIQDFHKEFCNTLDTNFYSALDKFVQANKINFN